MDEYGKRGSERGNIEPRRGRQGYGSMLDWEPFRGFFPGNWNEMFGIDVNRRDDGYEIHMAVPGFRPDDLDVRYQDGVITVVGRNERRNFTRSLTVPDDVDEENIQATVEHGMLVLTLQQHPKRQPRRINVASGGESAKQVGASKEQSAGSGRTTTGDTTSTTDQSKTQSR